MNTPDTPFPLHSGATPTSSMESGQTADSAMGTPVSSSADALGSPTGSLLEELARMADTLSQAVIQPQAQPKPHGDASGRAYTTTMTAVVRLVPRLDMVHWREMVDCGLCDGWLALDIPDHLRMELRRILENSPTREQLPPLPDNLPPYPACHPAQSLVDGLPCPPPTGAIPLASPSALPGIASRDKAEYGGEHGLDPVTGMLSAGLFLDRLTQEAGRARRGRTGLSLVLFELEGRYSGAPADVPLRILADRIWQAAHHQDIPGRLQSGLLALALPGVGHFQALALAERVISDVCRHLGLPHDGAPRHMTGMTTSSHEHMEAHSCLLRAGVAEISGQGDAEETTATVLDQAREALQQATADADATVRDRVRLYRKNAVPAERETLVLASEKQFLFFGGI